MNWKNLIVIALLVPAVSIAACSEETGGEPLSEPIIEEPEPDPPPEDTGSSSSSSSSSGEADCPHSGPDLIDPETLDACPSYVCEQGAHCVPNGLVPSDFHNMLFKCNDDMLCVPDPFIKTGGNSFPKSCEAILGLEGRCLSDCIALVAERADFLDQDICDPGEVCAPCYDPFTFEPTGACAVACDPGAVEPVPEPQPKCCPGGDGTCLPAEVVGEQADQLTRKSCPEAGQVCVPDVMLDPTFTGEPCQPDWLLQYLGIDDGACLPDCLDAVSGIGGGSCPSGYKCAPCDALGESTGACGDDW